MDRKLIEQIREDALPRVGRESTMPITPGMVADLCDAALANAVDCEALAEKLVEVHRDFDGSFSTSMFGVTVLHTATKEQCEASAKECRESIAAILRSALSAKPQARCEWTHDGDDLYDDGKWETSCGNALYYEDPPDFIFAPFCQCCGRPISVREGSDHE